MDSALLYVVQLFCLAIAIWALVDCVIRNNQAFPAAGKLTKPAWLAITAIAAVVVAFGGFFSFLGIAAVIASIVYLVDVRPAVREITNGGNRW